MHRLQYLRFLRRARRSCPARVTDYRCYQLGQLANAQVFLQSQLSAKDVAELAIPNVFIATGARWREDDLGRSTRRSPPKIDARSKVITPDDIMDGRKPETEEVVIFDDDQGHIAGVLAMMLAYQGHRVTFVTPAGLVSPFTLLTLEQARVQARLIERGVDIHCNQALLALEPEVIRLACAYSGKESELPAVTSLLATERVRITQIYDALKGTGLTNLNLIGDAASPGLIADAVWSGHLAARDFERPDEAVAAEWFKRETISLTPWK